MRAASFLFAFMLVATVLGFLSAQETLPQPVQETPAAPPISTITVPPPPAEDPNEFRVSSEVELVLLDVSVKDSAGGFVSGLTKDHFRVFENKIEQKLSVFSAQDVPVTVGLVVDNSGSIRTKKPQIVTAALALVTNSNPQDEVFVVNFNDQAAMGLPPNIPFTGDRELLRRALLLNPARGRTALYDGLNMALDHLHKGRLDKKTLVLISDGGDNMSEITRDEIMRRAEGSLVTIYAIGIFDPDDSDKSPGFLKHIARITGGEAFMPHKEDELVPVCEKIAHDIRNRYSVGYAPANRQYDGKARKLQVIATAPDGKKYEVRTRTQYVASPKLRSSSQEGGKK